jgi:CheY-like chemotaxis protein
MTKTILIADDHAVVRKMVCSLFEAEEFKVFDAADGAEAVQKAQEILPDFIVLDLAMPIMNGLEAARALKRLMPNVPLLMFTNNEGTVMEQEGRSAGFTAVFPKSGPPEHLISKAKALLEN